MLCHVVAHSARSSFRIARPLVNYRTTFSRNYSTQEPHPPLTDHPIVTNNTACLIGQTAQQGQPTPNTMVHTFSVDLAPLLHENTILKQHVESLQKENHDLLTRLANTKEIEETLSKKYDTLQLDYNALQNQNKLLKKQVEDQIKLELENKLLKKEVEDLKTRVSGLEACKEDADGVDIRYAMTALEKWICLDIVGSKNKVKQGLYTLQLLGARPKYAKELAKRASPEALQLLQYYKDNGDHIAHMSEFTATELKSALLEDEDEKIDYQTLATNQKAKCELVQCLASYCNKNNKPFGYDPLEIKSLGYRALLLPLAPQLKL